MSNLTIAVDDHLIKQARVRAIQQGTSLSAKVREFLQIYVNGSGEALEKQRADATASLMAAIDRASSQTRPDQTLPEPKTASKPETGGAPKRRTLRDEMYDGDFRVRDRLAAQTLQGSPRGIP